LPGDSVQYDPPAATVQAVDDISKAFRKPEPEPESLPETKEELNPGPLREEVMQSAQGFGSAIPSIKEALKGVGKKPTNAENSFPDAEIDPSYGDREEIIEPTVTIDDIMPVWHTFIDSLAENNSRMYNALRSQEPTFDMASESFIVLFRNKALIAEFRANFKNTLFALLSQRLKNSRLSIVEKVIEADEIPQTKYYTDQDKLKYMIEKNPSLAKLKQEFNLDFE
jgi:hypothetical protein